jgi:hypothetical protein
MDQVADVNVTKVQICAHDTCHRMHVTHVCQCQTLSVTWRHEFSARVFLETRHVASEVGWGEEPGYNHTGQGSISASLLMHCAEMGKQVFLEEGIVQTWAVHQCLRTRIEQSTSSQLEAFFLSLGFHAISCGMLIFLTRVWELSILLDPSLPLVNG